MGGQPVRERLGGAAFQQVERGAGLAVDQERAVVLAAPDGEVIDPERPRPGHRAVRPGTCSANVFRLQAAQAQKNRRTVSRITTRRPPIAASASRLA